MLMCESKYGLCNRWFFTQFDSGKHNRFGFGPRDWEFFGHGKWAFFLYLFIALALGTTIFSLTRNIGNYGIDSSLSI